MLFRSVILADWLQCCETQTRTTLSSAALISCLGAFKKIFHGAPIELQRGPTPICCFTNWDSMASAIEGYLHFKVVHFWHGCPLVCPLPSYTLSFSLCPAITSPERLPILPWRYHICNSLQSEPIKTKGSVTCEFVINCLQSIQPYQLVEEPRIQL